MPEEITEPTQIEKPETTATEKEPTVAETVNPQDLLAELENLGITSQEKLQGVITASQQAGRNAQLLGDERKQTEMLQQQILELQNKVNSQSAQTNEYYSEEPDLKSVVKGAVNELFDERIEKPRKEAQLQYIRQLEELQNIKNDKRFPMVADKWDAHMNSPEVQMKLQAGQTSALNEYNSLVLDTMQDLLLKTKGTVEQLYNQGAKVVTPDAPHVESSQTQTVPTPDINEEIAEKIEKITKPETRMGTDDETEELLTTFIPKDDPIWQKNK
jgi:hypothetical protein